MTAQEPVHVRIARALATEFGNSLWQANEPLPSETELARYFKVTRRTLRKALSIVEAEGLITKNQGRHSLYRGRSIALSHDTIVDLPTAAREAGFRLTTKLLRLGEARAGLAEARALSVKLGETVGEICRLRLLDGRPVVQQRSVIPQNLLAGIRPADLERSSLYRELLRLHGIDGLVIGREQFVQSSATVEEAGFAGIEAGHPVVRVLRLVLADGKPVEYSNSILIGDYFRF
ncbi:MAG TPA: GntR family transcriptional regulator [Mesorhizobium sp.]|uniref:GntR family transcriptional regulator n=1 Tax=Mesorhizobium sp. TaxID=1871066 RepID=UPI002DDD52A5|nr:GntR family transcriptional regulator [Mesorhizobium sp.]HEV2503298.1 GntR family transcriptional regulator [Mesorhizobium sp.]